MIFNVDGVDELKLSPETLGAIFAGMLWYAPFFGDEARMQRFFGMPVGDERGVGCVDDQHLLTTDGCNQMVRVT